jgi:hypothetical protein
MQVIWQRFNYFLIHKKSAHDETIIGTYALASDLIKIWSLWIRYGADMQRMSRQELEQGKKWLNDSFCLIRYAYLLLIRPVQVCLGLVKEIRSQA